jgi:glycosyltransferase involved in cell wall biosynthesis
MKFTVITVCRNSEKVLARALSSLRQQTYQDREWVVIDGLSSDATLQIVRSYSEGIGALISESDGGIYDAMNKGITVAKGDIIFFLNSDDAFHDESVLKDVAATFEAFPSLELLFGNVVYQSPTGRVLRTFAHINADTLIFEDLCHQAVFARRSLFERIGGFDERFRLNADYDWLIRVFHSRARWHRLDRNVAIFSTGGAHMKNPAELSAERREVRLQYISPMALALGGLQRRITRRLYRLFHSHPLGWVSLKD